MGQIGMWQLIIIFLFLIFPVICFWRILPRAGVPSWVSLFCIIPFGLFVLLGVLAFKTWPSDKNSEVF